MDTLFDKSVAAGGVHEPSATRADPITAIDAAAPTRVTVSSGIECINCAIFYAFCDTTAGNSDYLGPSARQRVWALYNDEKQNADVDLLDLVSGKGGCHNCHSMGSCTAYCPNDLDPMTAIAGLQRETARRFFLRRS